VKPQQLQSIGRSIYGQLSIPYAEALGAALGISARTVQRWANGQNKIPADIAARLLELERIAAAGRTEAERRRNETVSAP